MTGRTYRLAGADRTGWLLGLGGAQVLPSAVGLAVAVVIVARTGSPLAGLAPLALGVVVGFARLGGAPLVEVAPRRLSFLTRRRRRFEAGFPFPGAELALPESWGRVEFVEASLAEGPLLVAVDGSSGLAAATLRVSAPAAFLLSDESEQVRLLDTFGDALAPLCREGGPVRSLRWTSLAAPAGRPSAGQLAGPASGSYREVLDLLAREATHEVVVTLTVTGRRHGPGPAEVAAEELRFLAERLAAAGLEAAPLGPAAVAGLVRRRLDPFGRGAPDAQGRLAASAGLASAAPLCAVEEWDRLVVDSSIHRAFHVVEWPRSEVPPAWTADLLLALPLVRAVCVVLEPVAPRASRRAVERLAAKLDSDEEQRRRAGFRVGAEHEAARGELTAREHELVAGHPEFDYSGFVVLSAPDSDGLVELAAQAASVAAAAGVELAPCQGRHSEAFALTLPLPFTTAGRRR